MSYGRIPSKEEIYMPLTNHALLLIFTLGIWRLVWIHRMTAFLNRIPDVPRRDPTSQLLACMFVPFYYIYWVYKTSLLVGTYASMKRVWCDFKGLNLLFAIFIPFFPPILIQEKINTCIAVPSNTYRAYGR